MKRTAALVLALALLVCLCACGKDSTAAFRTLEVVGTKQYGSICRGGDKLTAVIDAVMQTLAGSGTLSALSVKWLGSDRNCLDGDAGAFAALEALPEPRTLIFGVEADAYPLAYAAEDGHPAGLCADLALAAGELLGWDVAVTFISAEEVAAQLSSGNIDCALGFDPSSLTNASKYSAGNCFLENDILLAVRTESEVTRIKDLKGSRVGTVGDPAILKAVRSSEKLTKYASGATEYLSLSRCIDALDNGWCAAIVVDELALAFYREN